MNVQCRILWLILAAMLLPACTGKTQPVTIISPEAPTRVINLYLKDYSPGINPGRYEYYRDKKICLSNITNAAADTTTFFYFSKDRQVRYTLAPKANSPIQPIPSFLWYAYQKALNWVGLEAVFGCASDMTELWITLLALAENNIQIRAVVLKNARTLYEKELAIALDPTDSRHAAELSDRAFGMIDQTVIALLDDPGVKEILLRND